MPSRGTPLRFGPRYLANPEFFQYLWPNNDIMIGRKREFEVCFAHIRQIKRALGIGDVITRESSWIVPGTENARGMQIDLVIDRDDRKICLCEMKFRQGPFTVDHDYAIKIQERIGRTMEITKHKKPIISVLITTYGLQRNEYAGKFQKVVTMDDLFE